MANVDEILKELGSLQEPFDEKETFEVLGRILSIIRTYEEDEKESDTLSLRREIEGLREDIEKIRHKHKDAVKREDTSPENELVQERSYCRKADDVTKVSPVVGSVILKDPSIATLWRITGLELVEPVVGEPTQFYGLKFYYRGLEVDAYGNLRLVDEAVSSAILRCTSTALPAFYIAGGTLPDTEYS